MPEGITTIIYPVKDLAKAKERFSELLDGGAQPQQDVKDAGGGKLVASVTDAGGNAIGLIQEP
ncbi:VOC family protein [Amycolatopsis sp. NPDC059021]|uniref:VOC family protein n=1 Tax=Amycolatopsis sp. NPDC059021 TaxID=3346704 RepID=UPI00366DD114